MIGEIYTKTTPVSAYQPPKEIQDLTSFIQRDFQQGQAIIDKPWRELGDLSITDRTSRDQKTFNAFVDETIEDPSEAWQWRGTRSKARNKAIAMHAQLTAGYIIPMFMAQNDSDEEDRDFADIMRNIIELMVYNSEYKTSFLQTTMAMLINPVSYLGAEYAEVYQKIKVKGKKGYTTEEIIDEVLSGFKAPVYSPDQILISNAYELNIQKQRFLIKKKFIDYSEAQAKYCEHENWDFVQPGVSSIFNGSDNQFYDVKDDDHPFLVQETTYLNRREDTEICFIGGVYMGDSDEKANPIKHRSNQNAPKYNITPFGYQRINEHFFFFKSLMNAQYWDNILLDAQYELGMNRAFLDTHIPIAVSGSDKIDSDVIFPKSVIAFEDKDTKITPLLPQANLGNMFAAMNQVEKSMEESSISGVSSGQLPQASQKATSVAIASQNAKILLEGVGKTLAESIVQYGSLMADCALQHLTVPQIEELGGGKTKLKYKSFILGDKVSKGKSVSTVVRFDESLLGAEMTDAEKRHHNLSLYGETLNKGKSIFRVNPELFARMKYLVRVEPERMFPKNEEFVQAMLTNLYTILQNNPFVSLEALTRKLAYSFFRGEADEIMQPAQPQTGGPVPQTSAGAQAMNKASSIAVQGMGGIG